MKKNKSGFTLIELLAVIVILAVILVIAIPRILDVIDESKLDSIKSSARMIINSAEKKNMIDKVNGSTEEVTCDNSVKLSKEDYESCKITIDEEGKATINLVGKGKFDGYKCIGTNDNLNCTKTESLKLPANAVQYIEYLYSNEETRTSNGLKKDNTEDENIRYYGSDPNNYVRFNNELWRIIGVFENNVKLVRSESLGNLSWDSSESSVNDGWGVNQWGESTHEDGSYYEGADLQVYLNKMYYGGDTTITCYGGINNKTTTCPTNTLDNTAKSLIDNHTWNTGAPNDSKLYDSTPGLYDTVPFYKAERGKETGKICNGRDYCNDTVTRKTEWTGYIGLPYVTDWAYASGENICETNMNEGYYAGASSPDEAFANAVCKNNNWMNYGSTYNDTTWFMSPDANPNLANNVWLVYGAGAAEYDIAASSSAVVPSIYLKSNVLIESGTGTSSNPYTLKLSN